MSDTGFRKNDCVVQEESRELGLSGCYVEHEVIKTCLSEANKVPTLAFTDI
jgi:hypothetical protein